MIPVVAALGALLLVGGCSSDQAPESTPADVLATAKTTLDETSGVRLALSTADFPPGINGLTGATGVATHAPAFDGEIQVVVDGVNANAKVLAADGDVYAILPFTTDYAPIDPGDYGAPDPADLMSTQTGLSSLLTAATDVTEGKRTRQGETVSATYAGTLTGTAVKKIIPSAQAKGEFDATFTVADEGTLDRVVITGPFYPDSPPVTYTIDLDSYGTEQDITAP